MPTAMVARSGRCEKGSRRAGQGFTLFGFAVILILAGILMTVGFNRYVRYQQQMERALVDITIMKMRSELRLRVADLMMRDRMRDAGGLLVQNPLSWLAPPPANYLGEFTHPKLDVLESGNWLYDATRREVVYLPRVSLFPDGSRAKPPLRLRLTYSCPGKVCASKAGFSDRSTGIVEGLALDFVNRNNTE